MSRCEELHALLSRLPRHTFPFDESLIPLNGVYVLFERGETGHGGDRVVRVGTHTGRDQLVSRLTQHFLHENKDRSIFRKHIGRSLLCRDNDDFLQDWDRDLTSRAAREAFSGVIDTEKLSLVERRVSAVIRERYSFVVLPIEDKEVRLRTESRIVSTVSSCHACGPSPSWLGHHSPKEKIVRSGLWQVNELWKDGLTRADIARLRSLVG